MRKKQRIKNKLIIGTLTTMTLIPIIIVSCSQRPNNEQNPEGINEEISRVNSLNLRLKNYQLTDEEISNYLANPHAFLNPNIIDGWIPNTNFSYIPRLTQNASENQIRLTIEIINNADQNQRRNSKEFVFTYTQNSQPEIPPPVTPPTNQELDKEVVRINNLNLSLKNNQLSIPKINEFMSNPNSFLSETVLNGWSEESAFSYNAKLKDDVTNKQLKLIIEVIDKKNPTNKASSKEFSFTYTITPPVTNVDLQNEVNRLNSSGLHLIKDKFANSEYISFGETNIRDVLTGFDFNDNKFKYEAFDFLKNQSHVQFKFRVSIVGDSSAFLDSKDFDFLYDVIPYNDPTTSKAIKDEITRINNGFHPNLMTSNITFQDLLDINVINLWNKVTNTSFLNFKDFDYVIASITKYNGSNKEITFNLKVDKKNKILPDDLVEKNHTNPFKLSFTLKTTPREEHQLNTEYLKNNLVDPITNGNYAFATPGSGTGNNSVIPSGGPKGVQPSPGVPADGTSIRGKLYNEHEVRQVKNTFSLAFVSYGGGKALGTGWILDYKLPKNNEYPTTWYIATNAHVIQNLKVPNDTMSPERYEVENEGSRPFHNTQFVQMKTIKNPQTNIDYELLDSFGSRPYVLATNIPAINLKTVYIGNDFLYTSPKDFSSDGKWANSEEYADFAVMEVKFQTQEEARTMTQNYVNEPERHFKYKKSSFLKNNDDIKQNWYSVVGFPDADPKSSSRDVFLYTSRGANSQNEPIDKDFNKLQNLATSPWYQTFNNKRSVFDAALGLSFFGYNYRQAYGLETFYNSWGLIYPLDFGNLGPGSSGSMLMDKDGYTVGIHFAADPNATIGLSTALYNEGFNYQGRFGSYNLEGYDLIEGGFPNQRTSYKSSLKKLYGSGIKTKLFPNGLN